MAENEKAEHRFHLHVDVDITDDLTTTQEMDLIKLLSKAATAIAAIGFLKNKYTINTPTIQALLNGAANLEAAAANWNGGSQIAVPTLMPPGARR